MEFLRSLSGLSNLWNLANFSSNGSSGSSIASRIFSAIHSIFKTRSMEASLSEYPIPAATQSSSNATDVSLSRRILNPAEGASIKESPDSEKLQEQKLELPEWKKKFSESLQSYRLNMGLQKPLDKDLENFRNLFSVVNDPNGTHDPEKLDLDEVTLSHIKKYREQGLFNLPAVREIHPLLNRG